MILNLKELNKLVNHEHFKMFNLKTALNLIEAGMWIASADLMNAYYSVWDYDYWNTKNYLMSYHRDLGFS